MEGKLITVNNPGARNEVGIIKSVTIEGLGEAPHLNKEAKLNPIHPQSEKLII